MIRWAASWALYGAGDLVSRIFDDWTRIGLRGPLYGLYNGAMMLSIRLQGDGPGPWEETKSAADYYADYDDG